MSKVILIFDKSQQGMVPKLVTLKSDDLKTKDIVSEYQEIGDYLVYFKKEQQSKKLINVISDAITIDNYRRYMSYPNKEAVFKYLDLDLDSDIHLQIK